MTATVQEVHCYRCGSTTPEAESYRCSRCREQICLNCFNVEADGCFSCTTFECANCREVYETDQSYYCPRCEEDFCEECSAPEYCYECNTAVAYERIWDSIRRTKYEKFKEEFESWVFSKNSELEVVDMSDDVMDEKLITWAKETDRFCENKNSSVGSMMFFMEG